MTQPSAPAAPVRFSDGEVERYARQLVLSEIGGPGQQALKRARVLIVGMGGVGNPAALYLAAAGVGTLGLIDDDTVALSNLQRQIAFTADDPDRAKVEAGAERLNALNPHVTVQSFNQRITPDSAAALMQDFDLALDGTDDFETRLAVNAACVAAGKPLVSGALGRWSGQVSVFEGRPCYQCLVPEVPPDAETCARVGVVGALAGVIGAMAALEAIKLITGAGEPLTGRLMLYDGLAGTSRVAKIAADPACPVCASAHA
ncbi:HesA/MoeB/ThiF family protein [Brevundimonas guildfordensis]|uniref:Molybdopterin-synthase adenylyltransferase MoeB n=1 Tax=Brevundimonas guildfordensis TaxID=2762241 RepID=A0ABR8R3P1_9CAUL|nr:molybdopterin-synthase adenylyltransferase MoeB [Brevundimonas guildfordensis]MBD7942314.1 molybdopterin-synthase adenylyltransferase MoeB [Brevundimonas guildfordensis]